MAARHVLAIDQGTTGTTALVLDDEATVVGRGYAEFTQHFPKPGWIEHDPQEIWTVSRDVAEAALSDAKVKPGDLAALGITNQRETTVLWDRATGEPVHNAIVWQDRRTAAACRQLRDDGHTDLVRARTGLVIDPYFAGTKIAWLLDNVDGLRARAEKGEIAFGTIDSWLIHRLTGGREHLTDATNASRTLLLDIDKVAWDDELCGLLKVPRELLPEVRPSSAVYAETDPEAFLGASVPIAGAIGDQQAALFAQACFEPGQAKNTYGTGSFVLMNTGTERVAAEKVLTTIAYGIGDEPVTYALEGPILVSGSAVQWLRDQLDLIDDAAETAGLADSVEDTGDVFFVPALAGLGAPHWDPHARGTIVGITRGTTKAHLARAVLEGIAFSTRDVVDAMREESGITLPELRVDGGGTANPFLMQFQADLLGIPVDVPTDTESTSLGSAYLAGLAAEVYDDRAELAASRTTEKRYEPQMGEAEREERYGRWQEAVERSRGWAREEA